MNTQPSTRPGTIKKLAGAIGVAAIVVALAAMLGEWGWGEQSRAESLAPAGPTASAVVATSSFAPPTDGAPFTTSADVRESTSFSALDGPGAVPAIVSSTDPSTPAPMVVVPAAPATTVPGPTATTPEPAVTSPAPVTEPTDGDHADLDDDHGPVHGVDDHAVDHSDRHDESEAIAHGRDEEARRDRE